MSTEILQSKITSLSPELKQQIQVWVDKYPKEHSRSALLPALTLVQKANGGWLSEDLVKVVANYLDLPVVAVFEVATFYSMFELKPVGRHKISVCTNVSCMLRGCDKIVDHISNKLGIGIGETTPDGQFTLQSVECLAACVNAPMMMLDDDYHENLTPEKVDSIINKLKTTN